MKWRAKIIAMFLVVWVITAGGETVFLEAANGSYASNPSPADGAVIRGKIKYENIYTTLVFVPGADAVEHTAYFSDDYSKVESRAQDANLGPPRYPQYPYTYWVGYPGVDPEESLVRGMTYYWCVDETDSLGTTYPGDIWEFTVWDYKASFPDPPDGAVVLYPVVLLSWKPGYMASEHDVYLGTNFNDVNNAVYDHYNQPPEFVDTRQEPNILITGLLENTTYYWRVDETVNRGPPDWIPLEFYKGDVWSFTIIDNGKAQPDFPADGAVIRGDITHDNIYTTLVFVPGATAVEHTAYFSDDYSKVESRAQDANLGPPRYPQYPYTYWVGYPGVHPEESLVRGMTYYWCVDETDSLGTTYPGDIWEFTVWDYKASAPSPYDGQTSVSTTPILSWKSGFSVDEHDIYFGTSLDDVNDPYGPFPVIQPPPWTQPADDEDWDPIADGGLTIEFGTTYYWRVDEIVDRGPPDWIPREYYKGDVWSFKTAGLIAHWKFDEGSGSIAYDSAGKNDGTIYGAAWATGVIDGALDFDGDDYVEMSDDPSLRFTKYDSFSICSWVKPVEGITHSYITCKMRASGQSGYFGYRTLAGTGPTFGFSIEKSMYGQVTIYTGQTSSFEWHHVTAVYDNMDMKLYLDGELENTDTFNLNTGSTAPDKAFTIGARSVDSLIDTYFDGAIDDVRIYDRALSAGEIEELYNSVPVPPLGETYHVDCVNGDNTNDGLTPETAFKTIQRGINVMEDLDTVLVWPGVYNEEVSFWGDAITVKSAADAAIVETDYGYAFSFFSAEGHDTVLSNFVIRNSQYGIYLINGASPTLKNLTIVNNDFGISAFNGADPDISSCIFWNNYYGDLFRDPVPLQARYSCIEEGGEGEGNISVEPGFVDVNGGDYHLLSERGRYWPEHVVWVLDDVTSPCIDGGDPAVDPANERMPNGGRINMGAYGNTAYASMSECWSKADFNCDGIVNFKDFAIFAEDWLNTALVVPDVTPPEPAPVIITIGAVSSTSLMMTASEAFDESGVQYYFEAQSPGGHDSGWLDEPNYTDVNLVFNTIYCYRVKARDKSANYNETIWSTQACGVTVVLPDTLAPLPDPMQWDPVLDANGYDGRPLEVYFPLLDQYGAYMKAIDADDQAPAGVAPAEVEYYFQCQDDSAFDSGWRTVALYPNEDDRRTYTVPISQYSGHAYRFRVRARDASANLNETDWSDWWPAVYRDPP